MNIGVKELARKDIKKALETIIVIVIYNRCYNNVGKAALEKAYGNAGNGKIEIYQHIDVKNWLRKYGAGYDKIHPYSVDLLMTLGHLDNIVIKLKDNSHYFSDGECPVERFREKLKHVEDYIAEIIKDKKADNLPLSRVFTSAAKFFTDNVESLRSGADVSISTQYHSTLFSLLRKVCRELKLGTLHQMVTDMQMEPEELTDRRLTGHTFHDHVDDPESYEALPLPAEPHKRHIEKMIERAMDSEDNEDIETFTDNIGTVATVFFSSYIPELSGSDDSSQQVIVFDNIDKFHI